MNCGLGVVDHIIEHYCLPLDGKVIRTDERGPVEWSMRCPVCRRDKKLSVGVGKKIAIVAHCQRGFCPAGEVRAALAKLCPSYLGTGRGRARLPPAARPDVDALVRFAKQDLPASAYRLGILRLAGFSAAKARAELGIPKSTYYDAQRALGS